MNKIKIIIVFSLVFLMFSNKQFDGYVKGETNPEQLKLMWKKKNWKSKVSGLIWIIKKRDNIEYSIYCFAENHNNTNYAVATIVKNGDKKEMYYKINYNSEKGETPEWFDNNKDGIKQDDEIFYLWY